MFNRSSEYRILNNQEEVDEVNLFEISQKKPFKWKIGDTCYWVKLL